MRSRVRDVVALLLLVAVLVPYAGYLVNGEMPLIENAQAMASTGLLLGGLAFWVLRSPRGPQRIGKVEAGSAALGLTLYILTIALAATSAAEFLLAGFIGSLLLVFIADLLEPKPRR
ncbi:hypothetical protein [Kribbella sp. HUAS MG21]|uniref:Uncharacterized protein n=1 Tax=Kribbella sp. HUAS MG21 TaxID=3160966 RepID=A0AAU7T7Z6_9ACTN